MLTDDRRPRAIDADATVTGSAGSALDDATLAGGAAIGARECFKNTIREVTT